MKVHKNDAVVCPYCGEDYYEAKFMVDTMSPNIPHITDCSECGEPFSVTQVSEDFYEVSWV